jgi:hypothetical protein
MSQRVVATPWFIATTAVVSALITAFASWLAVDSSTGVRVVAVLVGIAVALGVMLVVAWALSPEDVPKAPSVEPVPAPAPAPEPVVASHELEKLLDTGRALHPDASDPRVAAWIADVRHVLQRDKPGIVGYFDALSAREYADDRERLETHVARLTTIVRDFL